MVLPPHLQNLPEDQKVTPFLLRCQTRKVTRALQAMLVRVLSMTPEQINMLAPAERASIMQLVRVYPPKSLPRISRDCSQRASLV